MTVPHCPLLSPYQIQGSVLSASQLLISFFQQPHDVCLHFINKGCELRKVKQFVQDHTVSCRARIQTQVSGAPKTWTCTYSVLLLC